MWDCPRCNLENELENLACSACQEPRPYVPLQQLIINSADEYYRRLEAHNLGTTTIRISSAAIITPYLNQVRTIKGNLPHRQKEQLFTVHKAQGREWDTVIFSVVDDGKPGREPWFTDFLNSQADADKLLNTALSRAKKELIMICNVNYWLNRPDASCQLISQLIRLAEVQNQ